MGVAPSSHMDMTLGYTRERVGTDFQYIKYFKFKGLHLNPRVFKLRL